MKGLKYFFWGILAAAMSLVLQVLFQTLLKAISSLAVFVLIEEFLKFIFLKKIIFEERENFWNAAFLGMGFSSLEIILSLSWHQEINFSQNHQTYFMFLGLVLVHLLTSLLAGKLLTSSSSRPLLWRQIGIVLTTFCLHFLYNIVIIKAV